jgi:glycosyltransferase involved in cell wall biosynthesis
MRILHLVHQYLPEHVGGTELYTHGLTQALAARHHDISLFHRRSAEGVGLEHRLENGINIWAAWNGNVHPGGRFLSTFGNQPLDQAFAQVRQKTNPDLVHVQHLMGLPTTLLRRLQKDRIPYVVTLWDFWWVCANAQLLTNYSQTLCTGPKAFMNCAKCALARMNKPQFTPALPFLAMPLGWRNKQLKTALMGAHRLIAPARFVRDWYAAHGMPAEKMVLAPPGLDYPAHVDRPEQERERPFRVGYIGGLSWQKGVHILVQAFRSLDENSQLWIAGDTSFDPDYTATLRRLAGPNVRFLGKLSRAEIWRTLARLDVVVVTSMWYETFCFVISEAFAMGVPVIASKLGVMAERVQDGVDGLLVPPGDVAALQQALHRLRQNPHLLAQLRAGIQPVPRLNDHVHDIETIYENVLSGLPKQP